MPSSRNDPIECDRDPQGPGATALARISLSAKSWASPAVKFWIAPLSWHRRAGEESRGGKPAALKATHRGKDPGIIRLIFPDAPNADDDSLEEISWGEFFRKFDEADLAL